MTTAHKDLPALPWQSVVQAIRAVAAEARERGAMYPQHREEQDDAARASRDVCEQIEWYATKGGSVAERLPNWPRATIASRPEPASATPEVDKLDKISERLAARREPASAEVAVAVVTKGSEFGRGLAFLANGRDGPKVGTLLFAAPQDKHCRWPMCESKEVQDQAATDAAEALFGAAPQGQQSAGAGGLELPDDHPISAHLRSLGIEPEPTPAPDAGARDAALEDAAALCDEWEREDVPGAVKGRTIRLADAVRALKTAPAKPAQDLVAAIQGMRCVNPYSEDRCNLYKEGYAIARQEAAALVAAHLKAGE